VVAQGPSALDALVARSPRDRRRGERLALEEGDLRDVNARLNQFNTKARHRPRRRWSPTIRARASKAEIDAEGLARRQPPSARRRGWRRCSPIDARHQVVLEQGDGKPFPRPIEVSQILRADEVNRRRSSARGPLHHRLWRFVPKPARGETRTASVWPRSSGTMLMTLLMTIFVVPSAV